MTNSTAAKTEQERLHDKCVNITREGRKIGVRLEALEAQIKKLRLKGKLIKAKSRLSEDDATNTFLSYAKKKCLELCDNVQKAFPREIRDIIYGHITCRDDADMPDWPKWGNPEIIEESYFRTQSETQLRKPNGTHEKDHWWDPDFVGVDMVREIGENYYRSSYFQFGGTFDIIPRFRATDQWNLAFTPVLLVSKVGIEIKCKQYYTELIVTHNWGDIIEEYKELHGKELTQAKAKLLVKLEFLFGFRPGTDITIVVNSVPEEKVPSTLTEQEWMCENPIKLIFPVLRRLKDSGCRVRAVLENYPEGPYSDWAPFVSQWNPVSFEAFKKAISEHTSNEELKVLQYEIDREGSDNFDISDRSDAGII
ncbi:hypothetical protein TUN199_07295 [Pyrenophora tritici-repentis]|nr:hypothetical protein Alg130_06741 [Pyrenophora tritici-repentis]KAI0608451.1 hypothetical protein TUN205_07306 [Pyrenophora tritici-repentis]KAI0620717.1 hypothetical protein TUN199_07295 [Pyrenophora tritici-repentis]